MAEGFSAWAHLEAMGHRGHWGLVSEAQIAGASFLHIEVYKLGSDDRQGEFFYPAGSIYCITPCTEEKARLASTPYDERPGRELVAGQQPWSGMAVEVDDDDDEDAELVDAEPF